MPVMEVRFKLEKETKGALRYQEVDEKGELIEQAWAKIGTLYVRKSAFERGAAFPQLLRMTVETIGPLQRDRSLLGEKQPVKRCQGISNSFCNSFTNRMSITASYPTGFLRILA